MTFNRSNGAVDVLDTAPIVNKQQTKRNRNYLITRW